MGLGLLAWSIGDVVFTFESQGGASPPTPSAADAFYLMMYPLAYLAIMLLIRGEIRSFKASVWLDGAVAGLGAAAIVCAFVFDTILSSLSGSPAEVATNLAYPVGDLILLAIAVERPRHRARLAAPPDHPGRSAAWCWPSATPSTSSSRRPAPTSRGDRSTPVG